MSYAFIKNRIIKRLPCSTDELSGRYGIMKNGQFYGISYYKVEHDLQTIILNSFIPKDLHSEFEVSFMVINTNYAPPHTDNGILIAINYYIQTGDAETKFWKESDSTKHMKLADESDGFIYDESTLECTGSFKAKKWDVWALKVKSIHSVECQEPIRTAYCMQSSTISFDDFMARMNSQS
jgi:hypothetical protein